MDYLDFLHSGKGNISQMFEVCKACYQTERQHNAHTAYFIEPKKTNETLNMLMFFGADMKVQAQREQMVVMSSQVGLPLYFDTPKS